MRGLAFPLIVAMTLPTCAAAGQPPPPAACSAVVTTNRTGDTERADGYARLERPIPPGTRLCRLKALLEQQAAVLPEHDLDDRSPLPKWFRILMRKEHPDLATSGPYQYPKTVNRVLQRLLDKPDDPSIDELLTRFNR